MLKPIPQEEPDKQRKRRSKSRNKSSNRAKSRRKQDATRSNTAHPKPQKSPSTPKKCIITDTYKQLLTYTSDPNKHTDREISDIILSMHRSILHLEQARIKKRNKRRRK